MKLNLEWKNELPTEDGVYLERKQDEGDVWYHLFYITVDDEGIVWAQCPCRNMYIRTIADAGDSDWAKLNLEETT